MVKIQKWWGNNGWFFGMVPLLSSTYIVIGFWVEKNSAGLPLLLLHLPTPPCWPPTMSQMRRRGGEYKFYLAGERRSWTKSSFCGGDCGWFCILRPAASDKRDQDQFSFFFLPDIFGDAVNPPYNPISSISHILLLLLGFSPSLQLPLSTWLANGTRLACLGMGRGG